MDFVPYPSIPPGWRIYKEGELYADATPWVATHKLHGCNFIVRVARDGSLAYGRRNGFLAAGEKFYNYEAALAGLNFAALASMCIGKEEDALAVYVYMELYGGMYPGMPAGEGKCVQRGIYYANTNRVRVFDVFVQTAAMAISAAVSEASSSGEALEVEGAADAPDEDVAAASVGKDEGSGNGSDDDQARAWDRGETRTGRWLPFHVARLACKALDIPFVAACFQGTYAETKEWCIAHAGDEATVDPDMPPLAGNAGEGHVARRVTGHRLLKFKNPAFDEITTGKAGKARTARPGGPPPVPGAEYLTLGRAASVLSKVGMEERNIRNLRSLAQLLQQDAAADAGPDFVPSKAFLSLCCAVMKAALALE
jgi:hypothetical protein